MVEIVQEIGEDIACQYPHPVYDLTLADFIAEVKECQITYSIALTDQEFLGIAAFVGFDIYEDEELLEAWRG